MSSWVAVWSCVLASAAWESQTLRIPVNLIQFTYMEVHNGPGQKGFLVLP